MRKINITLSIVLLLVSIGCAQSLEEIYKESVNAYESSDYEDFLRLTKKAVKIHPSQPTLLYNLAAGYSLIDEVDSSFLVANQILTWNASLNFDMDKDFDNLLSKGNYKLDLKDTKEKYGKLIKSSSSFTSFDRLFHIEDICKIGEKVIASDVLSGQLLIKNTSTSLLDTLSKLRGSAMAVENDGEHILYATSSQINNYILFNDEKAYQGYLYKIDLRNQKTLLKREIEGKSIPGSISISKDYIYVTNSLSPEIFVYNKNLELESKFEIEGAKNLQGLTIGANSKFGFLADYIKGIALVDLNNGKVIHWLKSDNYLLKGIDGINYLDSKRLLIIQNNSTPKRLAILTHDNQSITSVKLVDNALDYRGEPTNGHFVKGEGFYYIANSPWPFYDKMGKALSADWEKQEILFLPLDD